MDRTTTYTSNAAGLVTNIDHPTDPDVSFTYDQQGRRLSMTDGSGITTWTYDASGRTLTETQGRSERTLQFAYDGQSQRTSLVVAALAEGGVPIPGSAWTTTYGYDNAGRLHSVLDGRLPSGQAYVYAYNATQVAQITGPGGLKTVKSFDSMGRLLSTAMQRADSAVIDSFAYTYDAAGQRHVETAPETTRTFGYDQYRQLTSAVTGPAEAPTLSLGYSFDPIGNRTQAIRTAPSVPEGITSYTSNSVNQYTSILNPGSPAPDSPTCDLNGNTTRLAGLTMHWDEENRLTEVSDGSRRSVFIYDGLGRRVGRQEFTWNPGPATWDPGPETRFVWDGWRVIEEWEASPLSPSTFTLTRSYTLGTDLSGTLEGAGGIGGLLALTRPVAGSGTYAFDGNGNVVELIADGGSVLARYRYDPFGNRLESSGAWVDQNPFQFSSKMLESSAGFYYYGLRFYCPATGRWLSRDPMEEGGGLSLYGFVQNDPTDSIDPNGDRIIDVRFSGQESIEIPLGIAAIDKNTGARTNRVWKTNVDYDYLVHLLCENGRLSPESVEPGRGYQETVDNPHSGVPLEVIKHLLPVLEYIPLKPEVEYRRVARASQPTVAEVANSDGEYDVTMPVELVVTISASARVPFSKLRFHSRRYSGGGMYKPVQRVECKCEKKNDRQTK